MLLLDGGFQNFLVTYPMKTTNPRFAPKKVPQQLYPNLEDIEYTEWDEIKMKPKPTDGFAGRNIPTIDRTSKPSGFGQKPLTAQQIALEQEKFYDDVLKKEKEALSVGKEYINTLNMIITPSESDPTEYFNKQTELEYKFFQKENELNDTITTVEPELENLETIPNTEENPQMGEILARLKAKIEMHTQNKKMLEQVVKTQEELGPATREQQKRHLQVSHCLSKMFIIQFEMILNQFQ